MKDIDTLEATKEALREAGEVHQNGAPAVSYVTVALLLQVIAVLIDEIRVLQKEIRVLQDELLPHSHT